MKNFDENELIDKAMAGRLSADERRIWEALLAERPELQMDMEVGRALASIAKPPPVPSNFTALVLQEINSPTPRPFSTWIVPWLSWPRFVRAAGLAVVALGVGVQVAHMRNVEKQEAALKNFTHGLSVVAADTTPQPEAMVTLLKDFDAIRQMPMASDVDTTLLTALNQ